MFCAVFARADELPEKPPGESFPLQAQAHAGAASFHAGEPVVGTTYFYWYDIETRSHIVDHDGTDALTTHPADMNGISFKRAAWHEKQLRDMIAAGIDFLLPVFWGVPGKYDGWSFVGLPPLVEAHSRLQKEGLKPPAIGMFYDTSILRHNGFMRDGVEYHVDLTTDFGKRWFYTPIRDFFSLIPPATWARVDGAPIVFLYSAAFAKAQDDEQLDYVKRRFKGDFGVEPFIVKSSGWKGRADATYSWGGAVSGPLIYRQVAALGPGYDHSAVPGRTPLIVDRRDGQTYIDRWLKILALRPQTRPWMVHVETWNEWHEGTDIADSREYGRSYIVLMRLFADMWRSRTVLRIGPSYLDAEAVTWEPNAAKGLNLRPSSGDGVWESVELTGDKAIVSSENPHSASNRYLYFDVDGTFAYDVFDQTVIVSVSYRDTGCASFCLEYDNADSKQGLFEGAFRRVGEAPVQGTKEWKTAAFTLPNCQFLDRCNSADFRIVVQGGELKLAVRKVIVARSRTEGKKQ